MRKALWLFCCLSLAVGCTAVGPGSDGPRGKADGVGDSCTGGPGEYEGVDFTLEEAEMVMDMANRATEQQLDHSFAAGLDADTARNIVAARGEDGICSLNDLARVPEVGPANLERARVFSAVWERAGRGDADEIERLTTVAGEFDGVTLTNGEVEMVLEMVNNASVTQLDAIPWFRSDAAAAVVARRRSAGAFTNLDDVADVVGVGTRHVEYLAGAIADWRRFARTMEQSCGELAAAHESVAPVSEYCGDVSIEGVTFEDVSGEDADGAPVIEDVSFTREEAVLVLDLVNDATLEQLDAVLDRRAVDALAETRRSEGAICDLATLADAYWMGPAGLRALRRFSVTWEAARNGEGALEDLMAPADREGIRGLPPLNAYERGLVLEMANYATQEQLDLTGSFRSDTARELVMARENVGGFESLTALDSVRQLGDAHLRYLADNVAQWRRYTREMETRGACADFLDTVQTGVTNDPKPTAFLTTEEQQIVVDSLDNICPDTFCGGDWNYYVEGLECDWQGTCTIRYRAAYYYDETVAPDALEGLSEAERTRTHEDITDAWGDEAFRGTVESSYSDEEGATWLNVACELQGGFESRENLIEETYRRRYSEQVYDHFLTCLHGMEDVLWELPLVER